MLRDRYDPMELFALLPACSLALEPVLAQLDQLLDEDVLFQRVKADLRRRPPTPPPVGDPPRPVEVLLRMLVVKRLYRWSYAATEHFVADSLVLRQFCRVYLGTRAGRHYAAALGQPDRARDAGRAQRAGGGAGLFTEGDPRAQAARGQHRGGDEHPSPHGQRPARRWRARAQPAVAARQGREGAAGEPGTAGVAESNAQCPPPDTPVASASPPQGRGGHERAAAGLSTVDCRSPEDCGPSGARVRRVAGRGHPAGAAAGSAVRAGSATGGARPRSDERSHRARRSGAGPGQARESRCAAHPDYCPAEDRKPGGIRPSGVAGGGGRRPHQRLPHPRGGRPGFPSLPDSLAAHQQRFGKPPWLLAADRGVYSAANEAVAHQARINRVVIPYAGKPPPARVAQARTAWFRRGFRFRAGIEGRMSVLRRRGGLDRCRDHGEAGLGRWVGWGIVTANLVTIAHTLGGRLARHLAKAA